MITKPRGVQRTETVVSGAVYQHVTAFTLGTLREFVDKTADLPEGANITASDMFLASKDDSSYMFRRLTAETKTVAQKKEAPSEQA